MANDFDFIVVGGGVVGLMSALRVALADRKVLLLERDKLGSGATSSNHGIIHSGALFAQLHPEIVRDCREAQNAYRRAFPRAELSQMKACYFARPSRLKTFRSLWNGLGVSHDEISRQDLEAHFQAEVLTEYDAVAVYDLVFSSRKVLLELAQRCLEAGVQVVTQTPARAVVTSEGRAQGVLVGVRDRVTANCVILAAGLGQASIASTVSSRLPSCLNSRVDVMMAFRNIQLHRPIWCLEYGGPTLIPTDHGFALASRYGAPQPHVDGLGRWPVIMRETYDILGQLRRYFSSDLVDMSTARAYTCTKTEVRAGRTDAWGVEPGYAVIDHAALDGIDGLWSVVPGKMTLALHASRAVAGHVLPEGCLPLELPEYSGPIESTTHDLVADVPWLGADEGPNNVDASTMAYSLPDEKG